MIKRALMIVCLLVFTVSFSVSALAKGEQYNKPIPIDAVKLLTQAKELREKEKFDEAVAALKKAIALAPNFVEAHAAYIDTRDTYMEQDVEVKAEYELLQSKEPDNPVYMMAMALTYHSILSKSWQANLLHIIDIAPDWSWAHYARAYLAKKNDADFAIAELEKAIQLDHIAREPYLELITIYSSIRDYDSAIEVAKRMSDYPGDTRETGIRAYWQSRMRKAMSSEEELAKMKPEVEQIVNTSQNADLLNEVPVDIFRDEALSKKLEDRVKKLDPSKVQEPGIVLAHMGLWFALGEEDRTLGIANQQAKIFTKAINLWGHKEMMPDDKIPDLEKLFALKPGRRMNEVIYQYLFDLAEKADDIPSMVKYGEALRKIDPSSFNVPVKIARTMANDKVSLDQALNYAKTIDAAVAEKRPPAIRRDVDPFRYKDSISEETMRERYIVNRSLTLDVLGWTLYQMGNYTEAESKLQQSVELRRNKDNLSHWSAALGKVGRSEESGRIAMEADNLLSNAIKDEMGKFRRQPATDFTLKTVDGRNVKLSDLKGKVVLINFWATWCGPCISEIPDLKKLYEKYKDKGVEILGVSGDVKIDNQKVIDFAKKRQMNYPVLLGYDTFKPYSVSAIPTSIVVDRSGTMRYRITAIGPDVVRGLEIAINELLK